MMSGVQTLQIFHLTLKTTMTTGRYALVVIDAFSRYAWAQPLKSKTPQAVWAAMQTILDDANTKPERLWVDQGTEFYNKLWTDKLKQLNITRYSTFGEYKVSIAERFIRMLKTNLFRQFLLKGRHFARPSRRIQRHATRKA